MKKPEIIKKLEKKIHKELKELNIGEIFSFKNGYAVNERGNIGGLNLRDTELVDISFLKDFHHLTQLNLSSNQITDISPIFSLTALTALDLGENQIANILPISPLTALTTLDLNSNVIVDISPVSPLTALTELYLNDNQIADIKPIFTLIELTELHLYSNQITDISPISSLTTLTYLYLSENKIADISPISTLNALIKLELDRNQIIDISPILSLTALTILDLSSNEIADISPVSPLTALTYLNLMNNQIADISPISQLTALTELNLVSNQITDISLISPLTALTTLALGGNQIANISPISQLTALTKLNLISNQIVDIWPISSLTALTKLYLTRNQIIDISPISPLTTLNYLNLRKNKIVDVSPIAPLTALNYLDLVDNQITDISPISPLTALTELDLISNKIADISPISSLTSLTNLYLGDNQIKDISPIAPLTALTTLDLGDNQIEDISPLIGLKNLKKLFLNDNKITRLPEEVVELGIKIKWEYQYSNGMILENNPLEIPPLEIVKQGTDAVRNYFNDLKKGFVQLLHAKLLIVGNGEVGKTTLMKKLKDNQFQVEIGKESSTHGIKIVPWELTCCFKQNNTETVKINFWDFGGQDIYHATHQFFLTKRSLYLFVWEARREEESRSFDYWLNIIKLLSANSPVIVVMNKHDLREKLIDQASFKEKFNNIVSFLQVSCITGKGILDLTEQIRSSLGNMNHLQDKVPKVWLQIRDHLKKEKKDYISLEDYFTICQKYNLDEKRAEYLSDYLHDLGVILHYRHDKLLENTVILNPEWATEAVYKLVDTRKILENKGRFEFDDLKNYWDKTKFPRHKHAELVQLMEKFELCFPIIRSDIHIVPELLPAERPEIDFGVYKGPGNLHFQYHYEFMPEGILTRFISRMYYLIKEDHFWKNGVELCFEDSTAIIISDLLNRKMKISVSGSCKSELLAIIRNDFEHIHNTLNMEKNKQYYEMIPCNCSTCGESGEPHLFKYEDIKKFAAKNKSFTLCPISVEEVSLEKLLKGYERPKPNKDILKTLIITAHQVQGIAKDIKDYEDSCNTIFATLLSNRGIIVKDQSRWGISASGKSAGEVDIKIETPDRETEAIIEAFNLENFNSAVINSHLAKIFGYDPSGLAHNFIIVYSEAEDFWGLWKKYLAHIPGIDFTYKLKGKPEEQETDVAEIKLAHTKHLRQGKETTLYHLFINMKHKGNFH